MQKIKEIIPDNSGYKVLLIDSNRNVFVLKYDISFKSVELVLSVENK